MSTKVKATEGEVTFMGTSKQTRQEKLAILRSTLGELLDIFDPEELVDQMDEIMEELNQKNVQC